MVDAPAPRRPGRPPADSREPERYRRPGAPTGYGSERGRDPMPEAYYRSAAARREAGLPGWLALLVLLVIAGIGGIIDVISGSSVRGGFNIGLVIASVVAILLVRRRSMLTIVVAPPLVYAVASGVLLYFRSGGLDNRKVLLDAAVNWLVYGFPAMAIATAAVLVIAGVRVLRARRGTRTAGVADQRPGAQYSRPGY